MPEPTRYQMIPEAMQMRYFNASHRFLSIFSAAQTITPAAGKRIVVSWARLASDMTAATCVISCTGVDSVTVRYSAQYPGMSGPDGVFFGATDQGVTFTKGGTVGTYSEMWVTYFEV